MIALLSPKLWMYLAISAAIAAVIAFGGAFCYRAGKANVRADFDNYKLDQAVQTQKAEVAARAEETRRESEKQKVIDEARTETAAAQSAAVDAAAAAVGLRQRVAALVAASRATSHPNAASGGAPADPISVLADVLSRIDEAAGRFATAADNARIAGQACEASYNSLTTTP